MSAVRIPGAWVPLLVATDCCKGCGLCLTACVHDALALDESQVNVLGYHPVTLIDPAACTSCALCARVCPDCVLSVYARPKVKVPR
jgi:2-oxoglutarate ferredoxin oxidoreductase subunit delta